MIMGPFLAGSHHVYFSPFGFKFCNMTLKGHYPCCSFLDKRHVMKGAFVQKGAAGIILDMKGNFISIPKIYEIFFLKLVLPGRAFVDSLKCKAVYVKVINNTLLKM
jgi:hypothetical protein